MASRSVAAIWSGMPDASDKILRLRQWVREEQTRILDRMVVGLEPSEYWRLVGAHATCRRTLERIQEMLKETADVDDES